jgi:uncharacterized membrane protein (UPF0127 family)
MRLSGQHVFAPFRSRWLNPRGFRFAAPGAVLALLWAVMWLALGPSSAAAQGNGKAQQLPTITLHAGLFNIQAMVASSPQEREIGLMYRREMGTFEGMLFIFDTPAIQCFWMRNTLIPLDAAFIDDSGTIINIEAMRPLTKTEHCSQRPVRYVLEMNRGWFAKRGMGPGFRLSGGPFKAG